MAEEKKTWKDKHPKLAKFIDEKVPKIGNLIGGILPDKGFLGVVKNLITNDPDVPADVKQQFNEKQAEFELEALKIEADLNKSEDQERTKRHHADMTSDSWMSKNIRPMTLAFLLLLLTTLTIWDSCTPSFTVEEMYVELLKILLVSVFLFYFGGRELTKMMSVWKKK